jgi:hypothetical protein
MGFEVFGTLIFPAIPGTETDDSKRGSLSPVNFPPDREAEGIVSYVVWEDRASLTITSKSENGRKHSVDNLYYGLDPKGPSYFLSDNDSPNQWVCWDFSKRRVCPTHYTIESMHNAPRSWVVEGSMDGRDWRTIDKHPNNSDLKQKPHRHTFSVSKSLKCRFIRLTQTDENHKEDFDLDIYLFDFFGELDPGPSPRQMERWRLCAR